MNQPEDTILPAGLLHLLDGQSADPFTWLGRHLQGDQAVVRVLLPGARAVTLCDPELPLHRIQGTDLFEGTFEAMRIPRHPRIEWLDQDHRSHRYIDPYSFPAQLTETDLRRFTAGGYAHTHHLLGTHPHRADGIEGTLFALWAPHSIGVSLVGEFNGWHPRLHPMRLHPDSGVWELFLPDLPAGSAYNFHIRSASGENLLRTDPYAWQLRYKPDAAAMTTAEPGYTWNDDNWLKSRAQTDWQRTPMSVYEVHLGSWQRDPQGRYLGYRELAGRLAAHVGRLGFTHVGLLPVMEHQHDESWGYQASGYFAPTSRFGTPEDFRCFVDLLHRQGIGVLLDWLPAHFPRGRHGLAAFDGSALYERNDTAQSVQLEWGKHEFDLARKEVRSFLISNAVYWIEEFHIDGLRVASLSSLLYLDHAREAGDWKPNRYGGRENLEAVDFLREFNRVLQELHPDILTIAEESSGWPQISRPTWLGGLGFSMKWHLDWAHNTLAYLSFDPVYRHYHHDLLTFAPVHAANESFMLALSHEQMAQDRGSLLGRMPGDEWQRFANLRLLFTYLFTYPGKKLLFMGSEFAQSREWRETAALDWWQRKRPYHQGVETLLGDLNRLYREQPPLHELATEEGGFEWIDCHDSSQSVLSYLRKDQRGDSLVVILNFTPVPRRHYRIGLDQAGDYLEIMNSDSTYYAGSNMGNNGTIIAEARSWMGRAYSAELTLPPLAGIVLQKAPQTQAVKSLAASGQER